MLPYIIPIDVLNFYFGNVHYLLNGHKEKGLICVAIYCVLRLMYKIVKARKNKCKRQHRNKISAEKYDTIQKNLNNFMNHVDLSSEVSFQSVSFQVQDQPFNAAHVLLTFQARAATIDLKTNAVVELIHFDDKIVIANLKVSPKDLEELHGERIPLSLVENIPVSLAEIVQVQHLESTAGLSYYLELKAPKDAIVVQVLKQQGAIPFVRTNVAQTGYITFGSSNPIFGVTRNPFNKERSPGGPNSGEAVLIATGGSVLGVGTDTAGGLRIPAHFCGICGLKPTSGRISQKGVTIVLEGQDTVATCVGPMSIEVAGLVAFMKSMCVPLQHKLDPTVSLMSFNTQMYESTNQLVIGFFVDDGYTKCVPSVRRAVVEAKILLEHLGYRVIPFRPPNLLHMLSKLYLPVVLGDHFTTLIRHLTIDSLDICVRRAYYLLQIPYAVRWLWSWWLNNKNPVNATLLAVKCPQSVSYLWQNIKEIKEWKQQFISLMIKDRIDALLCPVLPFAAVKLGREESLTGCLTYCTLFNLLDFPAGTVPISTVTDEDLKDLAEKYKAVTSLEKKIQKDQLGEENVPESSSLNLPVGVQIASLPFQDELVLRILADLEKIKKQVIGVQSNPARVI